MDKTIAGLSYRWSSDTAIPISENECGCGECEECEEAGYPQGQAWRNLWNVPYENVDPLRVACTFYTLQAISMGYGTSKVENFKDYSEPDIMAAADMLGIEPSVAALRIIQGYKRQQEEAPEYLKFQQEAQERLNVLVDEHLETFYNYIDMAIGGELLGGNLGTLARAAGSAFVVV